MSGKIKQAMVRLFLVMALSVAAAFTSLAAMARISFSDPSAKVGEEVSVTMKFTATDGSALGNTDVMLAYDATLLEYINETENASGGNGAIRVKSSPDGSSEVTTTLRFTALRGGTATITVSDWEGYDMFGQMLTMEREGTSTVTIQGLETSSTDATLKSMQISPGTLTPSFTPNTTEYTTSVDLSTERLTVSAEANNDSAVVAVQGADGLQEGENTVICRVTAEDGTTVQEYTILVNKVEGGGETETESEEAEGDEPEVLAELDATAKKIRIIDLPEGVEVPGGLTESSVAIGEAKVTGWIPSDTDSPEYCILYGMNDDGEQSFYRYDLKEKTVQRCFEGDNSEFSDEEYIALAEDYNSLRDDYGLCRLLMIIFIAVSVILLILLIVSRLTRPTGGDRSRASREEAAARSYTQQPRRETRSASGRKLSREERYMMGEEDEYEEEDEDDSVIAYQPEISQRPRPAAVPETKSAVLAAVETNVEHELEAELARDTAAVARDAEPDDDDFDIVNLDDE